MVLPSLSHTLRKHTIIVSYPCTNPLRLQRYNNLLNYKNRIILNE